MIKITKKYKSFILIVIAVLLTGCSTASKPLKVEEETVIVEKELDKPTEKTESSAETDTEAETQTDDSIAESPEAEEGLYDRTYLEEKDGVYVYRMSDPDIIKKYDELYASAFVDVIASYKEATQWQNQSFNFNQLVTVTNLVLDGKDDNLFVNTGSTYEMDYGFDLNNVGYTYVDLDSDGVFELIFGVLSDTDSDWIPEDDFERAYGLADGRIVKFCEGGSRDLHWLGSDGCIYETGSGGAAYSGTWRLHFDSSQLKGGENVDWGSNGFVEDEFLGYWEAPIHICDAITDIDEQAKQPENQISEDNLTELQEEWESRKVRIDWLRMEYSL